MITAAELRTFVKESNAIENIRSVTQAEIEATCGFLNTERPTVENVVNLVEVYEPRAILRDRVGLDVKVGNHVPPRGSPEIRKQLEQILSLLGKFHPFLLHLVYEDLHPFTDGNGRSGRAIWAWQMVRRQRGLPLGFLHQFYYQTLEQVTQVEGFDSGPNRRSESSR